jgi:hypothetical protein
MDITLPNLQSGFTEFLRDPSNTPMPEGVPAERMRVYQDLVFRNIRTLLTSNFPVLAQIASDTGDWDALARGFIRDHRAQTPHFPLLAAEFLEYLEELSSNPDNLDAQILLRYPFARELAHYEWVDLDVEIASSPNLPEGTGEITPTDVLSLNPTAHVLAFNWPVHQIGPGFLPSQVPDTPTFLVVFQNRHAQSEFAVLAPMTALMLENLQQRSSCSAAEHIGILAGQYGNLVPADLTAGVLTIVEQLRDQGLVIVQTAAPTA